MAFFEKKVHKVKDEKEDGEKRILCMIPPSKYNFYISNITILFLSDKW